MQINLAARVACAIFLACSFGQHSAVVSLMTHECSVSPPDINTTDGTPLYNLSESRRRTNVTDLPNQVRVMVAGMQKTGSSFLGASIAAAMSWSYKSDAAFFGCGKCRKLKPHANPRAKYFEAVGRLSNQTAANEYGSSSRDDDPRSDSNCIKSCFPNHLAMVSKDAAYLDIAPIAKSVFGPCLRIVLLVRHPLTQFYSAMNWASLGSPRACMVLFKKGALTARLWVIEEGVPPVTATSSRFGYLDVLISGWKNGARMHLDNPGLFSAVVRYEDAITDPRETFAEVARKLGVPASGLSSGKNNRMAPFFSNTLSTQHQPSTGLYKRFGFEHVGEIALRFGCCRTRHIGAQLRDEMVALGYDPRELTDAPCSFTAPQSLPKKGHTPPKDLRSLPVATDVLPNHVLQGACELIDCRKPETRENRSALGHEHENCDGQGKDLSCGKPRASLDVELAEFPIIFRNGRKGKRRRLRQD